MARERANCERLIERRISSLAFSIMETYKLIPFIFFSLVAFIFIRPVIEAEFYPATRIRPETFISPEPDLRMFVNLLRTN